MKGEAIFAAMGEIDDIFVLAVADILEFGTQKIKYKKPGHMALIAAALLALLLAACAVGICFEMFFSDKAEHPKEKLEELWMDYEDLGLVVSFSGPEECHMAGFKANYLPSRPSGGGRQADGIWYWRIVDEFNDEEKAAAAGGIPYNILIEYISPESRLVFGGDTEIVKDESKGKLRIVELVSDLSKTEYYRVGDFCNWILIFDSENGYLIKLFSTLHEMEELEKIVAGLEIHVYTETVTPNIVNEYVVTMPGRG